jgi:hypothetical protein
VRIIIACYEQFGFGRAIGFGAVKSCNFLWRNLIYEVVKIGDETQNKE